MKQLRVQTNIFIIIDLLTNFITVTLTYQSAARLPASNMQAMVDEPSEDYETRRGSPVDTTY